MLDLRCAYFPDCKIAVTGSAGFIGRSVVAALGGRTAQEATIKTIPDRAVVIHLAANVSPSQASLADNVDRDSWLVEQVNEAHSGLVYASGNNVYPKALVCRIEDETRFSDYYGASKAIGEMLVSQLSNKPYCIMRIADCFGVNPSHGNLFKSIEKSLTQRSPLIQMGEGMKRRSYIYQPELGGLTAHLATRLAAGLDVPPIMNACYAEDVSVKEMLAILSAATGLSVEIAPVENDASALDFRSMQPGPFAGYEFKWPSLPDALRHYAAAFA